MPQIIELLFLWFPPSGPSRSICLTDRLKIDRQVHIRLIRLSCALDEPAVGTRSPLSKNQYDMPTRSIITIDQTNASPQETWKRGGNSDATRPDYETFIDYDVRPQNLKGDYPVSETGDFNICVDMCNSDGGSQ